MRVMYIRRARHWRKPRRPRTFQDRLFRFLLLVFILGIILLLLFHFKLRPLIADFALAKASNLVTQVIDDSILEKVSGGLVAYDDLVTLEKDETGQITALKSNMAGLTAVRAMLISQLVEDLNHFDATEFGIPLGSLTQNSLLYGRGPEIPVRILSVGSVHSEFENSFHSTAINQTIHRIVFRVTVEVRVLIPGGTLTTQVESTVNVAETVIVGAVPDSYTYFSQFDNAKEASEAYFDYGAALENTEDIDN